MTAIARVTNGDVSPNLSSWIDDWFGRDFPFFMKGFNTGVNTPAVNIKETAESFMVEMAAPGMKKSDFNIHLDNNQLTISADTKSEKEEKDVYYARHEFGYRSFTRAFTLPDTINGDKISAEYKEGILYVTLPKIEEAKQKPARLIQIK